MNIKTLRKLVDSDRSYLGLIDPAAVFEWVHPRDVTALDVDRIVEGNRARYFSYHFPEYQVFDEEFESDDSYILDYIEIAVSHRKALASKDGIKEIPAIQILEALIFMVLKFETSLSFMGLERERLTQNDLEKCLSAFESGIVLAEQQHIKEYLTRSTYYFFCYSYVSPELVKLPEIQKFITKKDTASRLNNLLSI